MTGLWHKAPVGKELAVLPARHLQRRPGSLYKINYGAAMSCQIVSSGTCQGLF